ncbi:EscU/YscU/HrcU family type III secretion system export apparatus switch protein [Salmonella enterica subsp. enterica]|nr:EscU/YscU/HrcU family type III secretion system export apparatus switch protein [Salmonella enterica subsp. enterica serovar Bonn]EBZ5939326.1 EscU/YscU/HrcU family type III secretion system export apparatus switch protein [Salmonella enterica subsp. enterica serovar Muenchen]MLZ41069.1 EscU/YscU/HrcU family type III secretion system export apparatus switch protein [Salmonella enterica subsp. enterica serovar Bonn]
MSEKTEKPTPKKIRDAREKGQVVKSVEVTSGVQLLAVFFVFFMMWDSWFAELKTLMEATLMLTYSHTPTESTAVVVSWLIFMAKLIGTLAAVLMTSTVLSITGQVGLLFAPKVMANAGKKLNVVANVKQLFSMKNLFELMKSILKISLVTTIFYFSIKANFTSFQHSPVCGVDCAQPLFTRILTVLFLGLILSYIFFALADYSFQRFTTMKQLKMTKEEIKQEYKNMEGNAEIKQKRKQTHRELQHDSAQNNVKRSTVVIKNPTHIAICLWYDEESCPLPKVIDKAYGEMALKIHALAEEEGIPVIENIPLARGLMKSIAVNDYISSEFFQPVADVIRMIQSLRK